MSRQSRKEGRKKERRLGTTKRGLRPEKNKERKGKREGKRKKKGEGKKKTIESGCKLAKVRLTIGRESQQTKNAIQKYWKKRKQFAFFKKKAC